MEPMLVSESSPARTRVSELAFELTQRSAAFRASLPAGLVEPLAELVRSMNCYYSNLIEGHNTHPVDIERAIHNDLSKDPKKRDLQLEAKAHIAVQRWIDEGNLDGRELTREGLFEIHRRFTVLLPEDLLWVEDPATKERTRVVPGEQRTKDTKVGLHIAVSPGAIARFLQRFEDVYARLGKFERIIAAGPAHHRLLWIHPFADGNGRVTRLMSYAMLRTALDTGGLWSVSRGLARKVADYKSHLANCDLKRRNDLDGRGHLSEEAMIIFTEFFLGVCLDQVEFMQGLMQPRALRERMLRWAEEQIGYDTLPAQAPRVLDAILFKGSVPRAEVPGIINQSERTARNVTTALSREGIIFSPGPRDDWQIAFPAKLAPRLMPGLFP
jgi:Fic family protein